MLLRVNKTMSNCALSYLVFATSDTMASLSAADLKPLVSNSNNNDDDNDNDDNSNNNINNPPTLGIRDLRLSRSAGPAKAATVVESRNLSFASINMLMMTSTTVIIKTRQR